MGSGGARQGLQLGGESGSAVGYESRVGCARELNTTVCPLRREVEQFV